MTGLDGAGQVDDTSHLARETAEQPEAIARLLDTADALAPELAGLRRDDVTHLVIAARGSSDNAARYAQYLFGVEHRLPVALATPSLQTLYGVSPRFDGALVVGISQSGRSPDVVGVLTAASDQGRPTVAITNEADSPLADAAGVVVPLLTGPERSVAATKTYTSSLVALALLATAWHRDPAERERRRAELGALPDIAAAVLAGSDELDPGPLVSHDRLLVTGRGLNYSTAFEVALKVRELTGALAEAFSPPDLAHGPIAAIERGAAALLIAPDEPSLISQRAVLDDLEARGSRTAAISADQDLLGRVEVPLALAQEPAPWLTPVTAVLPGQVLAARWAAALGRDLDRPAGLAKVTETS